MRFLVDANLPLSVAPRIRALGHEATDVREIAMGNADDGVVARHARENAFCLITRDKDFGDIRNYPPGDLRRNHCSGSARRLPYDGGPKNS